MSNLNSSKEIGEKIQHLISSNNLTHQEFADALFVSSRTVRRWTKNGVNNLKLIDEIAKYFNVEVKDILFK